MCATNQYTAEKIQKAMSVPKFSVWQMWVDGTLEELKAFLQIIMKMALNLKAQLVDYFPEEHLDRTPFFKDVFPCQSLLQLFWVLHLVPPMGNTKCKEYCIAGEHD